MVKHVWEESERDISKLNTLPWGVLCVVIAGVGATFSKIEAEPL